MRQENASGLDPASKHGIVETRVKTTYRPPVAESIDDIQFEPHISAGVVGQKEPMWRVTPCRHPDESHPPQHIRRPSERPRRDQDIELAAAFERGQALAVAKNAVLDSRLLERFESASDKRLGEDRDHGNVSSIRRGNCAWILESREIPRGVRAVDAELQTSSNSWVLPQVFNGSVPGSRVRLGPGARLGNTTVQRRDHAIKLHDFMTDRAVKELDDNQELPIAAVTPDRQRRRRP
jgi:hypothetical protein